MMKSSAAALAVAAFVCLGGQAHAADVFTTSLRGDEGTTLTGSRATGTARVEVDRATRAVDVSIAIKGLTIDALWDRLVGAPIGPIHLHIYAIGDHAHGGNAELVLPVPFGPIYAATADGFTVTMRDYGYAEGAAALGSQTTFEDFLRALESGAVVLNIHTDAFNDGEISGPLSPAS